MARHHLKFGAASIPAWYGDAGPVAITEYRVNPEEVYPVLVAVEGDDPWSGTEHTVGTAKAGGVEGNFWVEYETEEPSPRFYAIWRVNQQGDSQSQPHPI